MITAFTLLLFIVSCDRPECTNTNKVFDNFTPEAREYKDELIKQLEKTNKSELRFWLKNCKEMNGSQFINVNIQSEKICAEMELIIASSEKGIDEILKTKGEGYLGAELKNLKFEIKKDSSSTEFIFEEISEIID